MKKDDFKNAVNLQTAPNIPIYEQLANFIRFQIRTNIFKSGEKMLPENDLCDVLNISRTTVRQAMEILVEEGLIIRYRRKGSFVADSKMKRPINNLYNFTENMKEINAIPSSIVLEQRVITATNKLSNILQLPPSSKEVFYLERIRCANDKPILIEKTSIPYYLCPDIEKVDFAHTSLYSILNDNYSLNLYHATEVIAAILIREEEAKLLRCHKKDAGYKITRISHLNVGTVCEYTTSVTRADMCEFQLELHKKVPGKPNMSANIQRNINLK